MDVVEELREDATPQRVGTERHGASWHEHDVADGKGELLLPAVRAVRDAVAGDELGAQGKQLKDVAPSAWIPRHELAVRLERRQSSEAPVLVHRVVPSDDVIQRGLRLLDVHERHHRDVTLGLAHPSPARGMPQQFVARVLALLILRVPALVESLEIAEPGLEGADRPLDAAAILRPTTGELTHLDLCLVDQVLT